VAALGGPAVADRRRRVQRGDEGTAFGLVAALSEDLLELVHHHQQPLPGAAVSRRSRHFGKAEWVDGLPSMGDGD
jgi:hypothetical protein